MATPLIIERPDLQSWRRRFGYAAVTLFFWLFYLYLWQPLLSLVLWTLGVGIAYLQMVELGGFEALLELLISYGLVIVAIALVYIGWAQINYRRFRRREQRINARELRCEETARHFGISVQDLRSWRDQRMLIVHHNPEGRVTGVQSVLLFPIDSGATSPHQAPGKHPPPREIAHGAPSRV